MTGNATPIQIMPMGDSITVGTDYLTQTGGGYRDPLYKDLTAAGISFTFVGAGSNDPTATLTAAGQTANNGFGGWHIQDLNNNLDGIADPVGGGDSNLGGYLLTGGHGTGRSAVTPDLILLEIGTNDLLQGNTTINQDLYTLVTHIHALSPNTIVLVAAITPMNYSGFTTLITNYNSYIKNNLVPSLFYTRFVDQNTSLLNSDGSVDAALLGADNVHPNRFGYPILATNWATAVVAAENVTPSAHNLTVTSGTGSGSYPAGAIVTINATAAAANSQFSSWMPSATAISNPYASLTTYVMPAQDVMLTANYASLGSPIIPNGTYNIASYYDGLSIAAAGTTAQSLAQQQTYLGTSNQKWDLTNLGGNVVSLLLTGTQEALEVPAASVGTLAASLDVSPYSGSTNQQWTVTPILGTTQLINNASSQAININGYATNSGAQLVQYTTTYTPNELWSFYPTAGGLLTYDLTVNSGTGGGYYTPGSSITVSANAAASGYQFLDWSGSTGNLANSSAATTTFTMSAQAATITAVYTASPATLALTVNNGTGSGSYLAGTTVTVTANAAPTGSQFAGWTGAINVLANPSAASTTLTMPATATTITAIYVTTTTTPTGTVSVQFIGGGASPLHGANFDYTAGAGSFAAGHWNSFLNTGDTTTPQNLVVASGLTDSTGAASAIAFQLHGSGAYYTGSGSAFTSTPPYPGYNSQTSGPGDGFLFAGFAYAGYSDNNAATLTLSGLTSSHQYSLLVYVTPFAYFGNNQMASLALAGGTTYFINCNGSGSTYQRSMATTPAASTTGNYVEFDNMTGSTSQTVSLSNLASMVGISGFQIIDQGTTNTSSIVTTPTVALTVNSGTGSGTYPVGTAVTVAANPPASGMAFAGWTGNTSGLASASASPTTFTVSSTAAAITSTYVPVTSTSAIVSVQFVGGGASPLHGPSYDYTAGAGSYSAGHWNPLLKSGNTTTPQSLAVTSGLTDSTGASSSLGFSLSSSGAYYTGAGTGFTAAPPYPGYPGRLSGAGDAFLYAGFTYAGYSNSSPTKLTVTGLNPSGTYSLLVYVTPFEGFGASQSATLALTGGATYYMLTNGTAGVYQQAASVTATAPATGNYVKFDNLTGSASQTVTLTNTSAMVGISGFQVVAH